MPRILAIDDKPDNLIALSAVLRNLLPGAKVMTELSGKRGIETALRERPDCILLDVRMPGMDGYEVCKILKDRSEPTRNIPVIMVTAIDTDSAHRIRGLEAGADAFLTKPFNEYELVAQVNVALRIKRAEDELRKEKERLQDAVIQRTSDLRHSYRHIRRILDGTINTISAMVEARDPFTAGHQRGVAELASAIADQMNHSVAIQERLIIAGLLHDTGKISVPSEILAKPGNLHPSEMAIVRTHAEAGAEILRRIPFDWPLVDIVRQHHERCDGSGYPDGLTSDRIRPESRILAVADVVEAMSSHRPYRPARGTELALDEIMQNSGKLYDKDVVDATVALFHEGRFEFGQRTFEEGYIQDIEAWSRSMGQLDS